MLTHKKRKYAVARVAGLGKKAAAIAAGCPVKTAAQSGSRYDKDRDVIAHIKRLTLAGDDKIKRLPTRDPLVYLHQLMNDTKEPTEVRADAAKALLPYMHSTEPSKPAKKT